MLREFDAFAGYPEPKEPRVVYPSIRTIHNRIAASYRGQEFYDGHRNNGYGGFKDDGRWGPIADNIIKEYQPKSVLQLNAHKGYLIKALRDRGVYALGIEPSEYAVSKAESPLVVQGGFTKICAPDKNYDLVLAASAPYAGNLADAIACLKEVQRVGKKGWVVLAAYEDENDFDGLRLLRYWFLTGTLILTKGDWIEVMKHAGYTGDYRFDTAKSLNLIEKK